MTDNNDQFHDAGSPEFFDEAVRRFLLGELSAAEQPLFEQCLFTDQALESRVRLAELDLTDDYVFERLSPHDRKSCEQKFLVTSNRRQKLQVSKVLRDRFSVNPAAESNERAGVAGLELLVGLERPAWRLAFAILILVVLSAAAWLLIKEPRIAGPVVNRIFPRRSPPPSVPLKAGHETNTSVPEHQIAPSPKPDHDQAVASPAVVSLALGSGVSPQTRELPALNLPKGDHDVVRLELALKPNRTGTYRAELLSSDGSSVFSSALLPVTDSRVAIDFDVPARLLKSGDYQIKLSRGEDRSKVSVASYYFRVR